MAKPNQEPDRTKLWGWKSIGAHFEVSDRAVRTWHKERNLPVHRLDRRVYAFVDELEQWRRDRKELSHQQDCQRPRRPDDQEPRPRRTPLVASAAVVLAVGSLLLLTRYGDQSIEDALLDPDAGVLWALDGGGQRVWQAYVAPMHPKPWSGPTPRNRYLVKDIDEDARNEILLNFSPKYPATRRGRIIAFDDTGQEIWTHFLGGPLEVKGRKFEPYYWEAFMRWVQLGNRDMILAVSHHHEWYPAHATLIDPKTGLRLLTADGNEAVYWHPGWIYSVATIDLDNDGQQELLLGGVVNSDDGLGFPSLAVLPMPFDQIQPHSETNFFGPDNRRELDYLVFPLPDIFKARRVGTKVYRISPQDGQIQLRVGWREEYVAYYLDYDLQLLDARISGAFSRRHAQLHDDSEIDHALTPSEVSSLKRLVRFKTARQMPSDLFDDVPTTP